MRQIEYVFRSIEDALKAFGSLEYIEYSATIAGKSDAQHFSATPEDFAFELIERGFETDRDSVSVWFAAKPWLGSDMLSAP